jgi:hypothetical protein
MYEGGLLLIKNCLVFIPNGSLSQSLEDLGLLLIKKCLFFIPKGSASQSLEIKGAFTDNNDPYSKNIFPKAWIDSGIFTDKNSLFPIFIPAFTPSLVHVGRRAAARG